MQARSEVTDLWERATALRSRPLGIAAQLVVLNFALQAVVIRLSTQGTLVGVVHATARLTNTLYALTGVPATLVGNRLYLSHIVLTINEDCAGFFVLAAYVALVASYPSRGSTLVRALGVGIPALISANLMRLLLVGQVSQHAPWAFDIVHDVLFRVAMVLLALVLWYAMSVRELWPWPVRPVAPR